ncbi:hypothetical protein V5F53_11730 [Xanthobacter sp. V4C-4]
MREAVEAFVIRAVIGAGRVLTVPVGEVARGHLYCSCEGDRGTFPDHGVDEGEELVRDGDEDGLWRLALEAHAVAHGGEGGDVGGLADLSASAPDAPSPSPYAAFPGVGRKAGQGGDAASAEGSQFGTFAEQGGQDGGPDARHRRQQAGLGREGVIGGDQAGDAPVDGEDLPAQQLDHGGDLRGDLVLAGAVAAQLFGFAHLDPWPAVAQEDGELDAGGADGDGDRQAEGAAHLGERAGIEPVGLGEGQWPGRTRGPGGD